ncbi:hypothetical protein H310_08460 [Aphanomyces invadans]|uniref:Reverse transcriptase/retrotransposon-derived protein RNase H-like domain-containing protein n=1 Tax=Aphanomyces invadans TaxID=157072 RepID=A0A024U072_9STRA|nr:hypothetical protein H310_08460 [Aphanomyces invadans]ETV98987.1 hypothetical protein H310_08460 [Aphanomyces invadans]|eukprot:XP_008872415.1 hypothetical protein H310_08460 [Aphanomyces invadans]
MEAMKLTVEGEVKPRLTFDTAEGTLVLSNLKCWVVVMPLQDGLDDVIVSRDVMARRGYCPHLLLAQVSMKVVQTINKPTSFPEEASLYPEEERAKKVHDYEVAGCGDDFATQLSKLLVRYEDVFRLTLGRDPPVDVAPLVVTLKQGAEPVRCKARRYSKEQRDFMANHVAELVAAGLCYRNPRSKWCSAPLIVKKPDANDFRMTVDVQVFFILDFFKGYWQFALDKTSQEMLSFLMDTGVYTPTRVLMGGTDSVAYCQSSVQEMFASDLYKSLLVICQERGLKLNPKKCRFYETEARWRGRIVSSAGVKHDPECIKASKELKMPVTGQDLHQFLCASVYKAAGGRTRQKVAKVLLAEVGWNADHAACLDQCKEALSRVVTLAHQKQGWLICVFADASDLHWGGLVTQIPRDQVDRELDSQDHESLMFLSGTTSGAA